MPFNIHKTVLQGARSTSLEEFIYNYDPSKLLEAPNNYLVDGAPLVKCLPNSTATNHLIEKGKFATPIKNMVDKNLPINTTTNLMQDLTDSIINIKNAGNYKQCIATIKQVKNTAKHLFYGALLINEKTILNPLHPLTAMLMLDEKKYSELHNKNYRIAIYTFQNDAHYIKYHNQNHSQEADASYIEENLNALIQVAAHQVETQIKMIGIEDNQNTSENIRLQYQISKEADEASDFEFYLSGHQMLTHGIVLPWYGTSFIKLNGRTSGYHISPMRSCNISGGGTPQSETIDYEWTSVCTGSLSNSTLTGLRSLNHANLLSPYNSAILAAGGLVYAQMAANKALQIYSTAKYIEGTFYDKIYNATN